MSQNPFRPSFGTTPPVLAGRQPLLDMFAEGLENGPGAPDRSTLYTGARGSGKTVMLNEVQDLAQQRGWVVIAETATVGLVTRLTSEHLPTLLSAHDDKATRTRLKGLRGPAGIGFDINTDDMHVSRPGLRSQLTLLSECLALTETGVLITLDEIHRKVMGEMVELATTLQHCFREERHVAFAGAGLPSAVSAVLNEDPLTFFQRSERHLLGRVPADDVATAICTPVLDAGRTISDQALDIAVEATGGYPFMIQLVGYHVWRQHPSVTEITVQDAETGVVDARRRLGALVHEESMKDTSPIDRTFLLAMSTDDGPSKISEIAKRMSANPQYVNVYRQRLIDANLIEPVGHGQVTFTLPYLREYLREHAASIQISATQGTFGN